jgi:hypothetical protein
VSITPEERARWSSMPMEELKKDPAYKAHVKAQAKKIVKNLKDKGKW